MADDSITFGNIQLNSVFSQADWESLRSTLGFYGTYINEAICQKYGHDIDMFLAKSIDGYNYKTRFQIVPHNRFCVYVQEQYGERHVYYFEHLKNMRGQPIMTVAFARCVNILFIRERFPAREYDPAKAHRMDLG